MNTLGQEFEARGIVRGDILFLDCDNALALVNRCQEYGRPILGIDSFLLDAGRTEPFMAHSADFGGIANPADSWKAAVNFLEEKRTYGFFFEVVIG